MLDEKPVLGEESTDLNPEKPKEQELEKQGDQDLEDDKPPTSENPELDRVLD